MKSSLLKRILKGIGELLLTIVLILAGMYVIFTIQGRAPSLSPSMDFDTGRNEAIIGMLTSEVSKYPVPQYVDTVKDPNAEHLAAVMGDIIAWQPVIINTGNTNLHAFFEVQRGLVDFSVAEGWEDIVRPDGLAPGIVFEASTDWELIEERVEDDILYSVYHYETLLTSSATTSPLYDYCQIAWFDINGKTYNADFDPLCQSPFPGVRQF